MSSTRRQRPAAEPTGTPVDVEVEQAPTPAPAPVRPERALVEVVVSHDLLVAGEQGEVELTPRVRSLLERGYLRLLGNVRADAGG